MLPNKFAPTAGEFGVQLAYARTGQIGGSNYLGGATPLTANNTTIFRIGGFAGRKVQFHKFGATTVTVPEDADGTILAYAYKYDASADAAVALTGALDLEALVTREETSADALSSLTSDLVFGVGDALEIHVVSNSAAIDTQPAGLVFTAEFYVLA